MKFFLLLFTLTILFSCSNKNDSEKRSFTEFELKHGIGPVKELITLAEIDTEAAKQGKIIFQTKCTSCHQLDEKLIGPALRNIVEKRSPEFILNMILNPVDMTLYHPVAKKMAIEYGAQMTFQNVTLNDAYKILDFLRSESTNSN